MTDRKWEQLMHDLKRLSKGIRILITEPDEKKRELIGGLLFDEAERLQEDLEELRKNGNGDKQ